MNALEGQIRKSVHRLLAKPEFADYEIRVGVDSCIVHLAGSVPYLNLRDQIEFEVAKIPGVRGIANRINAPGSPPPGRSIDLKLTDHDCDCTLLDPEGSADKA